MENREIKFRVWDRPVKKMYYDPVIAKTDRDMKLSEIFERLSGFGWVWMQSLGIEDKNGKEVYEGDILGNFKLFGDYVSLNTPEYIEVYWFDRGFSYFGREVRKTKVNYDCDLIWTNWYDFEVIGNIYENSDLISKLKDNK
jgi:uncharacterized phage protein (TIGR01671 family)